MDRRVLRIVVASPGDVVRERDAVNKASSEINRGIGRAHNVLCEVWRWETDAHPQFHPQGPQGAINRALRIDDCDLLIGIFWKRFGTPLKDAASGTEHEIRLAYAGWKTRRRPQIMLYFSQQPYSPRSQDELDQWGKVLAFKDEFQKDGLLWSYPSPEAFEDLLRDHITAFVLDFSESNMSRSARMVDTDATLHTPAATRQQDRSPVAVSQPQAFLSYTKIDDEFFGGAITALGHFLELGVKTVTGDQGFQIFQDVDGTELGQQWQRRIKGTPTTTSFLIPILTPSFFRREVCRDELAKFIEYEKRLGRDDLILPIYFVTVPSLEKPELTQADPLVQKISERPRFEWRSQADLPLTEVQVRQAARKLCEQIAEAIQRPPADAVIGQRLARGPTLPTSEASEQRFSVAATALKNELRASYAAPARWRILWVDDNPSNNEAERRALEEYGVEFSLATSTNEALRILSKFTFDAVISDMGRPPDKRAGYTLLDAIRGSGSRIPYFIYAGSRAPDHVVEAQLRGAQGCTNMPTELIGMVLTSLGVTS